MNQELQSLNEWFRSNKLSLNVKKTKYIVFGPKLSNRRMQNNNIIIDGNTVERISTHENTKSFSFLGIEIDETLTWKYHIDKVCSKIARANYIINKSKNFIPKSSLITLYQSLVHCHINYGLHIWGASIHTKRVNILQKKSIRIINDKRYNHHTEPLYKSCNILRVEDQYRLNVVMFMHSLKYNKLPDSFKELKFFMPQGRLTRQTNMASVNRARTHFSSQLPLHKFPEIWNALDNTSRATLSYNKLKTSLRSKILAEYSRTITCSNPRCIQCQNRVP